MADLCVRRGIDGGGGVVQDQDAGLFQQCAGNAETLLLAAGDVVAALLDVGLVLVGEALDKFIGAGLLAGVLDLGVGGVWVAQRRFSAIVPLNSSFFCNTMATLLRRVSRSYLRTSTPPMVTLPSVTSYRRGSSCTRLDLAEPVPPMMPMVSPDLMSRSMSSRAFSPSFYRQS